MKTRTISLSLVILAILALGSTVYAQHLAHYQLLAYLEKMPTSPIFPDSASLASAQPTSFEDNADLNMIEKRLQNLGKGSSATDQEGTILEAINTRPPTIQSLPPNMKQMIDALEAELKALQSVRLEYDADFHRLENIYSQRVDKVEQAARILQMDHPCKEDIDCRLEHIRTYNSGIIKASREKIVNEEYLLSVYLRQIKPGFGRIDNLLHSAGYGEQAITPEAKNLFRGAQQNQLMVLGDIIERIKLERIQISNCARLAQQGYRR